MMDRDELAERIAIKMADGTPEAEARRQAMAEQKAAWLKEKRR